MTYMDQRAGDELKKGIAHGVQIAGAEVTKLLKYLRYTGAVSSSVKDPIWKYRWVREHEPENFKKVYKWLDVKEYLICRLTGEFVMTQDSAFGTLLYDTRKGHEGWCKPICDMVGVDMKHLPEIKSAPIKWAKSLPRLRELGLAQGTAVYGGRRRRLFDRRRRRSGRDWRRAHLQRHLRLGGHRCAGTDG